MNNLAFSATWRTKTRDDKFVFFVMLCRYVFWGGFGLNVFFELRFLCSLIIHPCFVTWCVSFCFSLVFVFHCFFASWFDLCCCLISLISLFVWPRNRWNHTEPWFFIVFSLFCFFLFTSMLTPHNDLALSNWKHRKRNEKQTPRKTKAKIKKMCRLVVYPFWEEFALWSIFLLYLVAYDLPTCFAVVACCCPFFLHFPWPSNFELCLLFFTWLYLLNTTWLSEIKIVKKKAKEGPKHEWTKRRRILEECLLSFGASLLGSDLQVVCVWCVVSFCFSGGREFSFFSLSSMLQKDNFPKSKQKLKNNVFQMDFGCVVCFAEVSLRTPKEAPTQKKQTKRNKRIKFSGSNKNKK